MTTQTTDETPADTAGTPSNTAPADRQAGRKTLSLRVSDMIGAAAIAVLLAVAITFAVLWHSASGTLAARDATADDNQHAERVATDYALAAATINYQDANAWIAKLKDGTAPQLASKFDAAAPKLTEILIPLKWTSTAAPLAANVSSQQGGIYHVDVFLNVTSTNAQNSTGTQTTVTYSVTLDKNADWKITDVGGIDGALPTK
ncbi:MAG: Uncharacterized protein JWN03_6523 [Nocardia sp.]|uniref:hypothetical protein n=1 Tax=Nocardia sp. TaxID=1821 RepID=UPI00261D0B81|nr:hypothetical protein [Nocardia sp.]MCU1646248.1 Uncharacterized protein [Nocardia sp.]